MLETKPKLGRDIVATSFTVLDEPLSKSILSFIPFAPGNLSISPLSNHIPWVWGQ